MNIEKSCFLWCGGKRKGELELVQGASLLLNEYLAANLVASQELAMSWSPPLDPVYKFNLDGTVFSTQKESGVGVVIQDEKGLLVAAMSKKIRSPLGALEVELKAFETGLQFAKDVG
nr:hypothetical protein CFP56_70720 [Quercus suber]